MSALGDRHPEFQLFDYKNEDICHSNQEGWGRIANVSIPFVVLQALDDPLVGWRTIGTENPQGLADSGLGNIMLLLTKAGGHVGKENPSSTKLCLVLPCHLLVLPFHIQGWPVGTNPRKEGWKWMNNVARDFVLAVAAANQDLGRD